MGECKCSRIEVGMSVDVGPRNWREDCPQHGVKAMRARIAELERQVATLNRTLDSGLAVIRKRDAALARANALLREWCRATEGSGICGELRARTRKHLDATETEPVSRDR